MILTKKLIIKMDKEYNLANYMIILLTITLITFLNSYLTTLNGTLSVKKIIFKWNSIKKKLR